MRIAAITTTYHPRTQPSERAPNLTRYTNTPEAASVQGAAPVHMPKQPATPSVAARDGTGNGAQMPQQTFTYVLPTPAAATIAQIASYGDRGMSVDLVG